MAQKQVFLSQKGPRPQGPYSTAVRFGDLIFVSGIGPDDPATGQKAYGTIQSETELVFQNIGAILGELGLDFSHVLQTRCYLADMADFAAFNTVYARYFPTDAPARTTIQAGKLPGGIKVEIEIVAGVPEGKEA